MALPEFDAGDKAAFITNKVIRWMIKVPQRISRWPGKIRKKLKK